MNQNNLIFQQLKVLLPKALCTYSQFHVAAVLVTDQGNFDGFNIENSAYSNSICAERTALFGALIKGAKKILQIHLLTDDPSGKANMCGSCRQSLNDHVTTDAIVFIYDHQGNFQQFNFCDLLPQSFNSQFLN